jgi:Cyclic nucleotide-binding domain/HEAT repeats
VIAARIAMLLAFAATIPTVLNVRHGNRLVWTVCIAALPFFWMTAGYHVWRRICPLAVTAQLGRLVGRPGARKMGDWMARNYLYVQLALMIACLSLRLVATNGSAEWLAGFLAVVVIAAIVTSFIYGGKTWCNFLCPVGLVEKIHTEPSRSSTGHPQEMTSQCAPCVACKKHCPDIDLEQGYWKEATEQPRRVAYFAWPGIVIAFYVYYYLVDGGWDYYFTGRWAYEDTAKQMFAPGFTFAPAIPRVVAAPLTLIVFGAASYAVFSIIERIILAAQRNQLPAEATDEQKQGVVTRVRHGMLAFCGLVAFNAFYCFAGQPSLQRLPHWVVTAWGLVVVFSSTAMFMRRFGRREDQYVHEKFAQKILKKWEWGDAPPSDDLKDIYLLHTERTKQREARLRAYKETVREMVADGLVTRNEMVLLDSLRAQLGISDKDHQRIIGELSAEERQLFDPAYQGSVEQRLAKQQYRKDLERLVIEAARQGTQPTTLLALREERGVTEAEERDALAALLAPGGPIAAIYEAELAHIAELAEAAETANAPGDGSSESASLSLVEHLCQRRAYEHVAHALGVLSVMTKRDEVEHVRHLAKQRGALRPIQLDALAQAEPGLVGPLRDLVARLARADQKPLALAPILTVLEDGSRHLRAAVAVLLTRFEDDKARAALLALLDDPEAIVREAAVRAMGAKSRLTREVLTKVLDDPDESVRHAAVRAVSGGASSPSMPAIDPKIFAQTTRGVGNKNVYATLDANAAMASLTRIEKMMLIRQVPIFAKLDAEDLEELASIVEEYRIEAGQTLFEEGDVGDAVYLIVKGSARIFVGGKDRPEAVINDVSAGACIGEMAVLDSSPRSASVRALERTRALRVPGEGFKSLLSDRPEMSEAIVAELVHRMRGLMAQAQRPNR